VFWNGDSSTFKDVTTVHSYENKVQAATSVFKFPEVDTSKVRQYGLYEYPEIKNPFDCPSILSYVKLFNQEKAEEKFDYINAMLGAKKKVRVWILIFQNQPMNASQYQEWMWKRGNKNELILTIGIDKNQRVQWVKPISWTDHSQILVESEFYISHMDTLDLVALAEWIGPKIEKLWIRKPFSDFNYLTVEPPLWAVITSYLVTLLVNILLSWWVVKNEFDDENERLVRAF
jgi:hypothetical protein